jgi:hypothetical protein
VPLTFEWLLLALGAFEDRLHRLSQCIGAFGAAFDGGLARARIASGNGFFPAFAQATLESIPAATDSNRAIADYDRIGSSRHGAVCHG